MRFHISHVMFRRLACVFLLISFPFHAGYAQAADATLATYRVVLDGIPDPLSTRASDPLRGRDIALNPNLGNCVACHLMPVPQGQPFGDIAPTLDGVGSRLSEAQLRLRLVDPKRLQPKTLMPAYYKTEGLHRVEQRHAGRPILDANEIEDLVAYLRTLR